MFLQAGYATPTEEEVIEALHVPAATLANIMIALTDEWKLVRLGERVSISMKWLKSARDFVTRHIKENGSITAPELRDKLSVTRKYSVALLEYFDSTGLTRRIGDKRVLR
jgi:selenocysteine-specific elongation factor